jgi:hypothetical protein
MLSTHLYLGLPSGLFPSGFPTNNLYMVLFFPIHATCPVHLILLNLIILIIPGEEYKSCSSSLCSFLHPPVTSSLFGRNNFLSTLFLNTLSCTYFTLSDKMSNCFRLYPPRHKTRLLNHSFWILLFPLPVSQRGL